MRSLGCGAVAARVERLPGTVVWRDLGWETSYDPPTYDPAVDLAPFAGLGPFRFDAAQYEATLRPLLEIPPTPPAR